MGSPNAGEKQRIELEGLAAAQFRIAAWNVARGARAMDEQDAMDDQDADEDDDDADEDDDDDQAAREEWLVQAELEDKELEEVAQPLDVSLTSFVLGAASPDGAALKVLFVQHWVELDQGMQVGSFCLSAQNCAGHGEPNPVVLAQWRRHSEGDMFDPAHLARPAAVDELLASTGLEGESTENVLAFLCCVCTAPLGQAHVKRSLRIKRPVDKVLRGREWQPVP